jgi:preprotein translocase subunit SecG
MPGEVKWAFSFLIGAGLLFIGWKLFAFLVFLHVGVCLVLIIVILLQSGEAADLAGAFGGSGSQTAFGPRGAATFLSKSTTWCAVMFMFTSMALGARTGMVTGSRGRSVLEQFGKPAPAAPGTKPAAPAPAAPVAPAAPAPPAPAPPSPSNQ